MNNFGVVRLTISNISCSVTTPLHTSRMAASIVFRALSLTNHGVLLSIFSYMTFVFWANSIVWIPPPPPLDASTIVLLNDGVAINNVIQMIMCNKVDISPCLDNNSRRTDNRNGILCVSSCKLALGLWGQ